MADLALLTRQKSTATLTFDHPPTEVPTWSVGDSSLVTVTPAADGLSAEILSLDTAGSTTVTGGANGVSVTKSIDIAARAVLPTTVDMTFSTPVDA